MGGDKRITCVLGTLAKQLFGFAIGTISSLKSDEGTEQGNMDLRIIAHCPPHSLVTKTQLQCYWCHSTWMTVDRRGDNELSHSF